MKFFCITILLIFFLPLPLKSSIYYSKENYYIKFYNFNIIRKQKNNLEKQKEDETTSNQKPKKENKKKKKQKSNFLKTLPIKEILRSITNNKFKPHLRINGKLDYSLNDAANTAITYGIISTIMPYLYKLTTLFFKTKKFNLSTCPVFKDIFFVEININCIIFVSLGQIIYMLFLIAKSIIREKMKIYE